MNSVFKVPISKFQHLWGGIYLRTHTHI